MIGEEGRRRGIEVVVVMIMHNKWSLQSSLVLILSHASALLEGEVL
jgi:hypothetical protein